MKDMLYKLMNWPLIEGIIYSDLDKPNKILGPSLLKEGLLIQVYNPAASKVIVKTTYNKKEYEAKEMDEGFFAVLIKEKKVVEYSLVCTIGKKTVEIKDPYAYTPNIDKELLAKFNTGTSLTAYKYLGSHIDEVDNVKGVRFAVWAPEALRVSVVGDFNNWDGRIHQMSRVGTSGVFVIFIPELKNGDDYQYEIRKKGNELLVKSDPYAMSYYPNSHVSLVCDISDFKWTDSKWQKDKKKNDLNLPIMIYECDLRKFACDIEAKKTLSYRELAPLITSHLKEMGYTHIQIMSTMALDYKDDNINTYYYCADALLGEISDLKYFINYLHNNSIGVIFDWVPSYFIDDVRMLSVYDGTCLYEHMDDKKGYNYKHNVKLFNYNRAEVLSFLSSNAYFLMNELHADGLSYNSLAMMLYLDYGKNEGEWIPNIYGNNINLEAVAFIKSLNNTLKEYRKDFLLIADDNSLFENVTTKEETNSLGFDLKWDISATDNMINYIKKEAKNKKEKFDEFTFSMIYHYRERFLLPLSHKLIKDESKENIDVSLAYQLKLPSKKEVEVDEYAKYKALYAYYMIHPGKKLVFMGQDIAKDYRWEKEEFLFEYDSKTDMLKSETDNMNKMLIDFVKDINNMYISEEAIYINELLEEGFEWINEIDSEKGIISFVRKGKLQKHMMLVVFNSSDKDYDKLLVGVPKKGKYKEVINTDAKIYGGMDFTNKRVKTTTSVKANARDNSIKIKIKANSVAIFKYVTDTSVKTKEEKEKIAKKGSEQAKKDALL